MAKNYNKHWALLLVLTGCGSTGEMITDAGKCVSQGEECHQSPVPGPTGAPGATGSQGPKGNTGEQGIPGQQGKDGSSCTSTRAINGAEITCTDGSHVLILDGVNGQNGQDGEDGVDGQDAPPTAYTVVEIVTPCKNTGGKEVLLRLANNKLIAHWAQGNNQYLAVISPGNYVLTDGSSCTFTISPTGKVTDRDGNVWNPF